MRKNHLLILYLVHPILNNLDFYLLLNSLFPFLKEQSQLPLALSVLMPDQSRATEMGSWLGHNKGVTIDWAITIFHAYRPLPHGPQSHHPCHRQIKTIISHHHTQRPLHSGLTYARDFLKTKIRRYMIPEAYIYR